MDKTVPANLTNPGDVSVPPRERRDSIPIMENLFERFFESTLVSLVPNGGESPHHRSRSNSRSDSRRGSGSEYGSLSRDSSPFRHR